MGNNSHTETEEIAQLAWSAWAVTTPATCTAAGVETRTCPGHASTAETRVIARRVWNAWEETIPAAPTSVGEETRTCPGGASNDETRAIAKLEYDNAEKFCDERDGKLYKYVDIDGQVWTAENLNYAAAGSKCGSTLSGTGTLSDEDDVACDKYGRLYDWATAMGGAASSTAEPSGVQGVCPSGWHLPSIAEWDKLMHYVDGNTGTSSPYDSPTAGKYLKATSGWYDNGNGEDAHGFSALPGGLGYSGGDFNYVGSLGYWWSASEFSSVTAYSKGMSYDDEDAIWSPIGKSVLQSVRCVRD
jgi:uncharacterized protein (TIGR02145 family)